MSTLQTKVSIMDPVNTPSAEQTPAFTFPDHIFPKVRHPFASLPLSPVDKIRILNGDYLKFVDKASTPPSPKSTGSPTSEQSKAAHALTRQLSQKFNPNPNPTAIDLDGLFRWAREVLDFSQSQPGLGPKVIQTAADVVELVSESETGVTRFKGAALYIVGMWTLRGLHNRPASADTALEKFQQSLENSFCRAHYRIGLEVSFSPRNQQCPHF